jgi:hypothetical protein
VHPSKKVGLKEIKLQEAQDGWNVLVFALESVKPILKKVEASLKSGGVEGREVTTQSPTCFGRLTLHHSLGHVPKKWARGQTNYILRMEVPLGCMPPNNLQPSR